VDAAVGGLEALHDPGPAQGADLAGVIPDREAGQRASPEVRARVVPNPPDQNPVLDPRAVTPAINPSPDHPVRRRIPNQGLDHAPGRSPGIRVDPEVQAKNVGTETREVVPRAQTKMAIDLLTDHRKRTIMATINRITDNCLLLLQPV